MARATSGVVLEYVHIWEVNSWHVWSADNVRSLIEVKVHPLCWCYGCFRKVYLCFCEHVLLWGSALHDLVP